MIRNCPQQTWTMPTMAMLRLRRSKQINTPLHRLPDHNCVAKQFFLTVFVSGFQFCYHVDKPPWNAGGKLVSIESQ